MPDVGVSLVRGDITERPFDAIVNAANTWLIPGGGVDGAIHRAAGPSLLAECRALHGCKTGQAKITKGYRLPARHVIHTVGPVWAGGGRGEDALLASCYRSSLALARAHDVRTIAFPSISTGAYRFPIERASRIAVRAIREFLAGDDALERVTIVCFHERDLRVYESALAETGDEPRGGTGTKT